MSSWTTPLPGDRHTTHTVEPLNKGHFGANSFVRLSNSFCEVVPISEGPLSEVPL